MVNTTLATMETNMKPWEMTAEQFEANLVATSRRDLYGEGWYGVKVAHEYEVREAFRVGEVVPANVLAGFPDLMEEEVASKGVTSMVSETMVAPGVLSDIGVKWQDGKRISTEVTASGIPWAKLRVKLIELGFQPPNKVKTKSDAVNVTTPAEQPVEIVAPVNQEPEAASSEPTPVEDGNYGKSHVCQEDAAPTSKVVLAGEVAADPDGMAPVSGCRCRSCGANANNCPEDECWVIEHGAAYCGKCSPEHAPVEEAATQQPPEQVNEQATEATDPVPEPVIDDGLQAERWANNLGWNVGKLDDDGDVSMTHEVYDDPAVSPDTIRVTLEVDGGDAEYKPYVCPRGTDPVEAVRQALAERAAALAPPKPDSLEEVKAPEPKPLPQFVLLPQCVGSLSEIAAKENPRYAVTGVRVEVTGEGYTVIATDGRMLAIAEGEHEEQLTQNGQPNGLTIDQYPANPPSNFEGDETNAVIPTIPWVDAFRHVPRRDHRAILKNVAVKLGKTESAMWTTDLETVHSTTTRNVEGRYPAYREVFPKASALRATLKIDPANLVRMQKVAMQFAEDEARAITLEIYSTEKDPAKPANCPVVVRVKQADDKPKFTGVIMPLS